jgi:hypothetical protein
MLAQGSTLIVDDKPEDGQPISDHLKDLCIPHLFFHASQDHLLRLKNQKIRYTENYRVIFQDIALISGASPTKYDYDFAAEIIDTLLTANNGPWLLVTWSTWNGEDDSTYATELFNHLVAELDSSKAPYAFVVIDKSHFTGGIKHGTVKPLVDMDEAERFLINSLITSSVTEKTAMNLLMTWEKSIGRSISETLVDLHELSSNGEDGDKNLGKLLYELSKAVAGKSLSNNNSWRSLVSLLNSQLLDRIAQQHHVEEVDLRKYSDVKIPNIDDWKKNINRILNFETSGVGSGPGAVYSYKSFVDCYSDVLTEYGRYLVKKDLESVIPSSDFVKNIFLSRVSGENNKFKDPGVVLVSKGEFVVVDVTPPCDYAQNKAELTKFCAGLIVDVPAGNKEVLAGYRKTLLDPGYLWNSCEFLSKKGGNRKILIMNSRLVFSVPCVASVEATLIHASVSRIREEIFRDFTHWLWQQLSRPGYNSM